MINKERKLAKGYDTPNRCSAVTSTVYSGPADDRRQKYREAMDHEKDFYPEKSQYNIYIGDIHGHSRLSTGLRISTKGNETESCIVGVAHVPKPDCNRDIYGCANNM